MTCTELIVGVTDDHMFGPLMVFGLGGVTTEVLADHTARLTPFGNWSQRSGQWSRNGGDPLHYRRFQRTAKLRSSAICPSEPGGPR
jgi:hypothetical protein